MTITEADVEEAALGWAGGDRLADRARAGHWRLMLPTLSVATTARSCWSGGCGMPSAS